MPEQTKRTNLISPNSPVYGFGIIKSVDNDPMLETIHFPAIDPDITDFLYSVGAGEGQRLDVISNKAYRTPDLWWVLALSNGLRYPMNDNYLIRILDKLKAYIVILDDNAIPSLVEETLKVTAIEGGTFWERYSIRIAEDPDTMGGFLLQVYQNDLKLESYPYLTKASLESDINATSIYIRVESLASSALDPRLGRYDLAGADDGGVIQVNNPDQLFHDPDDQVHVFNKGDSVRVTVGGKEESHSESLTIPAGGLHQITLDNKYIIPGSITLTLSAPSNIVTDDGKGLLIGDVSPNIVSFVDYDNGVLVVSFKFTPSSSPLVITYSTNTFSDRPGQVVLIPEVIPSRNPDDALIVPDQKRVNTILRRFREELKSTTA